MTASKGNTGQRGDCRSPSPRRGTWQGARGPHAASSVPFHNEAPGSEGSRGQADPAPALLGFPRLAENSLTRSSRPKIEKLTQGKRQGPKSVPRRSCCSHSPREPVRLPPSSGSLSPPDRTQLLWTLGLCGCPYKRCRELVKSPAHS